jgi:hypothetical protein
MHASHGSHVLLDDLILVSSRAHGVQAAACIMRAVLLFEQRTRYCASLISVQNKFPVFQGTASFPQSTNGYLHDEGAHSTACRSMLTWATGRHGRNDPKVLEVVASGNVFAG